MQVRELKSTDAEAVSKLINQLTKNIVAPELLVERIANLTKTENWQYFVVTEEEKIVGFGGLAWYDIPSKGKIGWVEEIVVDETERGKGIGKFLMAKILEFGKEQNLVRLELTVSNPPAKHLYEKLGFETKPVEVMSRNY